MTRAVALTGGVASGKSAAARCFAELGVAVLDADVCARELVVPGAPALAEIVARFGPGVLTGDGGLDRAAMRARIFREPSERLALEAILHPRIEAALHAALTGIDARYALVAIPLLAEVGRYAWLDRVVVVDAPRALQLQRLLARDGIAPALAHEMIDAQATRAQRLALADDVLVNCGSQAQLESAVARLHGRLRAA